MRITVGNTNGQNILAYLRDNNIHLSADCGGRGVCGKCAVRVINAGTPVSSPGEADACQAPPNPAPPDQSPPDISGYTLACQTQTPACAFQKLLACQTPAVNGMIIELPDENESGMQIINGYKPQRVTIRDAADGDSPSGGFAVAVDIGTTTLAAELLDVKTGKRIAARSAVNRQRAFGADVISRISQASGEAEVLSNRRGEPEDSVKNISTYEKLHNYIVEDLESIIEKFQSEDIPKYVKRQLNGEDAPRAEKDSRGRIKAVAVAGNTTMLHLLLGYPCDTLGVYPFTPVSVAMEKFSREGCEVTVLPGVSAFIGADVMAGIIFCGDPPDDGFDLLIDLGTNCELALYNRKTILAASAAAGPVFEGGNISCGTGSVPGAVSRVVYLPDKRVYAYKTINNMPPAGICGSGAVDAAAQLFIHGIIDETGLLREEFFETGVTIAPGVVFTQKDVREMQLAKAAVRAGLEILLAEARAGYKDIRRVVLAGGFGREINIESACALGIIPYALKSKVTAVGNSSLGGAARVLLSRQAEGEILAAAARTREVSLPGHPMFNDLFMKHIAFTASEGFKC